MTLTEVAYKEVVDHLHDGLYIVDLDRTITHWNKAAERISGFPAADVLGRRCADNILCHVDGDGNCLCRGACPLSATMADGTPREADVYLHHRDGRRVPVSVRTSALRDGDGEIVGGIELFTDSSDKEATAARLAELESLAFLDELTHLANRRFLDAAIHGAIEENRRMGVPLGILFMDIDHFKRFNDLHGHDVGDLVLRCVAGTLSANSRPFDVYGRWGGEEFVGLIRNAGSDELAIVGNRMRSLVGSAYVVHNGMELRVTISAGATVVQAGDTVESLMKRADSLLYRSKQAGRNRLTVG